MRASLEPKLKEETELIFEELGINTTEAIRTFFKQVIQKLAKDEQLEERFRDHKLKGNYVVSRECHLCYKKKTFKKLHNRK